MTDPVANLNFLRKCGIQEWMLGGDETFNGFVTWFTSSITDENILTDEELVDHEELLKSNKYLSAAELKEETDNIANQYKGIWTYSERDVTDLERELEQLSAKEELYEDLTVQIRATYNQTAEDLTQLNTNIRTLESTEEKEIEKCLTQVEELQEAKLNNQEKINDLNQSYVKTQKYPLLIHQMSLEQYFKKCDIFTKCADIYMQKNFKIQNFFEGGEYQNTNDYSAVVEELEEITDRLFTGNYNLFVEKMTTFAQSKLIDQFKAQNWMPSSLSTLRNELNDLEIRNEQIYGTTIERLMNQLQTQLHQMAEQQAEMVIYESNKEKIERAKERMKHLKQFVDIVSNGLMNAECVWILMQFDMERVKKRNDFDSKLDEYRMEAQMCNRRMDIMNFIQMSNADDAHKLYYQNQLLAIFAQQKYLSSGSLQTSENQLINLIAAADMLRVNLLNCLENIVKKKSYLNVKSFLKQLQKIEEQLLIYVNDGPVNKHQYWCIEFMRKKIDLQKQIDELEEQMECYKEEFRQNQNKCSEGKFWRQKQVLWIWFLTEPNKVIKSIKAICAEAQLKSKQVAFRPIAGISRKQ